MTAAGSEAGIVFALPIEADAFERLAADRVITQAAGLAIAQGSLAGRRIAWCVAGVGGPRAERAARLLIAGHRPRLLVSAGFAGGLDPGIPRGGIVWPGLVCGEADASPLPLAGDAAGGPTIVTVDRILRTPAAKAALRERTGADLVDMETLAVARVAAESGLACHGVRVISDAAGDELPPDIGRLVDPQPPLRRFGAVLGSLVRRPRAALDLWELWERAVVDGRTLAAALARSLATDFAR